MDIIDTIILSPVYSLLVGGGGILVIIISVIAIISQRKKSKSHSGISVKKSKKTMVNDNELKNQNINVSNSEDTTISRNKG